MATKPTGNPTGRPSTYDPAVCERVIEMGTNGYSKTMMAAELGISRDTLYQWEKKHPDFADALSRAMTLSQAWWEKIAMTQGLTREFNAATWGKTMAARFPSEYRDNTSKIELTGKDGGAVQIDDAAAAARIASLLATAQQRKDTDELA